jgi:proteasome accessory factor C
VARFERVSEIYELLAASREPLSLASLCSALGASQPTVKRLVRFLRDELGVQVDYDREHNGYRLDRSASTRHAVVGPSYDSRELSALLSAYEVLQQIPPGLFRRETAALRTRLQQLLYKRPTGHGQMRDKIRLTMPQSRRMNEEHFHSVLSALSAAQRLRITYRSRSRDVETNRVVSPQRLTFYRSNWYLAAWCHQQDELRIFSVDRIAAAEITPVPSREVALDVLDAHLDTAYGIFQGVADQVAELKFSPESSRWVADEQWHPKQRVQTLGDGSVLLYVPYRSATELLMDILRHGPEVEVLAPASLRSDVIAAHKAALDRYSGRSGR